MNNATPTQQLLPVTRDRNVSQQHRNTETQRFRRANLTQASDTYSKDAPKPQASKSPIMSTMSGGMKGKFKNG